MDIKDVENLAQLARLELTEEEKKELLSDMDSILGYVKQIERSSAEVDRSETGLSGSTPGNLGTGTYNVWREDSPRLAPAQMGGASQAGQDKTGEFSKELIVEQFPDAQDGFLKVKKIL